MGVLAGVLDALNLSATSSEVEKSIREAEALMKEYCGLEEIPEDAYPLWQDITCAIYHDKSVGGEGGLGLSSLTMGDLSYTFDGENRGVKGLTEDFRRRLMGFRRGLFL